MREKVKTQLKVWAFFPTFLEVCSLLDLENPVALNVHFIFEINQEGEMRHAGRSCLSDTSYQNFELSSWQQSCVTTSHQDKELNSYTTCRGEPNNSMFLAIKETLLY